MSSNQRDWNEHLPYSVAAYRAAVHETTGYTPNYLFFGRENRAPLDLVAGSAPNECSQPVSPDDYVSQLMQPLETTYGLVRSRLRQGAKRQKHAYDMRVREAKFKPGERVWYYYPRRRQGLSPKWQRNYTDPFTVVKQIGPVTYLIQRNRRTPPITVHVDKLKACFTDPVAAGDNGDTDSENSNTQDNTTLDLAPRDQDNTDPGGSPCWPRRRQIPARYRD